MQGLSNDNRSGHDTLASALPTACHPISGRIHGGSLARLRVYQHLQLIKIVRSSFTRPIFFFFFSA